MVGHHIRQFVQMESRVLPPRLSLLAELATGYPDRLFHAIGHPVTWIGALIRWLDRGLNREGDGRRAARSRAWLHS